MFCLSTSRLAILGLLYMSMVQLNIILSFTTFTLVFLLRRVLKQLRRNRDEEAELMKNIKGWEVGTYFGEPIYFLDEENMYREPLYHEYFVHVAPGILDARTIRHLIC